MTARHAIHRLATACLILAAGLAEPVQAEQTPSYTLSQQTYDRLSGIQQLMDESRNREAITLLKELLSGLEGKNYEKAIAAQTLGYAYAGVGDYPGAITWFELSLAQQALPPEQQQNLRYDLAQLYMSVDACEKAIAAMDAWLEQADVKEPAAYVLQASAYLRLERYAEAIPVLEQAIALSAAPKEQWYQSLLGAHYELDRLGDCVPLLERMIRLFPHKAAYWRQLAGIHLALKHYKKGLATLELAYNRGLLTQEKDLGRLVQLYLFLDIPYKAGALLQKEIERGRIDGTEKTLGLLATAWIRARELDKAIAALKRAARISNKYSLSLQLARLLAETSQWRESEQILQGLVARKGHHKEKGKALMLLGMVQYELRDWEQARKSFALALKHTGVEKTARQWLAHLDSLR